MNNVAVIAAVCAFVGILMGSKLTADHYKAKIVDIQLEAAVSAAEQGKRDYEKLIKAQDAAAKADRDVGRLTADLERVRKSYADKERKAAIAGRADGGSDTKCDKLLLRGSELVTSCQRLLAECVARHRGLADAVK